MYFRSVLTTKLIMMALAFIKWQSCAFATFRLNILLWINMLIYLFWYDNVISSQQISAKYPLIFFRVASLSLWQPYWGTRMFVLMPTKLSWKNMSKEVGTGPQNTQQSLHRVYNIWGLTLCLCISILQSDLIMGMCWYGLWRWCGPGHGREYC